MYFYDTDKEGENRAAHNKTKLQLPILEVLQNMLKERNPYVRSFKNALEIQTNNEVRICLAAKKKNDSQDHPGCYNLPQGCEVAALMPGDQKGDLDVLLHFKEGGLQRISCNHRSYDPLLYVLLTPGGQDGFQIGNNRQFFSLYL